MKADANEFDDTALSTEQLQAHLIAELQRRILNMNADRFADIAKAKGE
jgi:hypothetical protein